MASRSFRKINAAGPDSVDEPILILEQAHAKQLRSVCETATAWLFGMSEPALIIQQA